MEEQVQLTAEGAPDYGVDTPRTLKTVAAIGLFSLALGLLIRPGEDLSLILSGPLLSLKLIGAGFLLRAALMARHSYTGKFAARDRLIAAIPWRGDEAVLDIGCGRGLLLIAAARKLTTGKATGIDIWDSSQLSDNWAEATWENARLEGVEDRVDVRNGDMREMPFDAATFDIAMTCSVIYDLDASRQRRKVTDEIFRVLKPGGRVHLVEPGFSSGLMSALRISGFEEVKRSSLLWSLFPPGRHISATKPRNAQPPAALSETTQAILKGDFTHLLDESGDSDSNSKL